MSVILGAPLVMSALTVGTALSGTHANQRSECEESEAHCFNRMVRSTGSRMNGTDVERAGCLNSPAT